MDAITCTFVSGSEGFLSVLHLFSKLSGSVESSCLPTAPRHHRGVIISLGMVTRQRQLE